MSAGPRRAGLLVPLFSLPSSASWGIGEIPDLARLAGWMRRAGLSVLQVLPLTEMPPGERSPYSAMTAMAIDPLYVHLPAVEDFASLGGEATLDEGARARLEEVRRSARVRYADVRAIKMRALRAAWRRFEDAEVRAGTARASAFDRFVRDEAWWLEEYARFRALHAAFDERPWEAWPAALRRPEPDALAAATREMAEEVRFRQYVQWVAVDQWRAARTASAPVALYGDLPFMVSRDSHDVWARQSEFRFDATVGVPPDDFSATGQDWGLPPWRWDAMAATDFAWMRARARRSAALFAGFRLDHLVGLYRLYLRPIDPARTPAFEPPDEPSQIALGERLVRLYLETGAEVIAEDLGSVPDFVRASIARLGVPGFKILRWERRWDAADRPFIDPAEYPARSVAMTGTHDTETLAAWWTGAPAADRRAVCALPSVARRLPAAARCRGRWSAALRDAIIGAMLDGAAELVVLPIQDVFGWRDRINVPGTVSDDNWTWRLPWPVDDLLARPGLLARADALARLVRESGRAS